MCYITIHLQKYIQCILNAWLKFPLQFTGNTQNHIQINNQFIFVAIFLLNVNYLDITLSI